MLVTLERDWASLYGLFVFISWLNKSRKLLLHKVYALSFRSKKDLPKVDKSDPDAICVSVHGFLQVGLCIE